MDYTRSEATAAAREPAWAHWAARLDVIGADKMRHTRRRDQDVRGAGDGCQVRRLGMRDRDRRVPLQQQLRHRAPDQL
jgi:hypothetical protein